VRCEGGKPCLRCRENQVECVDEPSITVIRNHDPTIVAPPRQSRNTTTERVKLACQNCRRDNKKVRLLELSSPLSNENYQCDDQRPCSRCVTRGEDCVHVGRGPKLVKLRCEGCRQNNKRCEDARPCEACVQSGIDCVTQPRKGRGHGTRVKAACINCRYVRSYSFPR
jgi:hypothetical protein